MRPPTTVSELPGLDEPRTDDDRRTPVVLVMTLLVCNNSIAAVHHHLACAARGNRLDSALRSTRCAHSLQLGSCIAHPGPCGIYFKYMMALGSISFHIRRQMRDTVYIVTAVAFLRLLSLPQVSAQAVSAAKVTIDPYDVLLNKVGVKLTVAFTPATTLNSGGIIYISYSAGFYATGITPTMVASSVPNFVSTFGPTDTPLSGYLVITTSGASISSGSGSLYHHNRRIESRRCS